MSKFIVGDKVITDELKQGFVTEITEHDEIVVKSLSSRLCDLGIYDEGDVVLDVYEDSTHIKKCVDQRPQVGDFTRYGIVNRVEFVTHGVYECRFIDNHVGMYRVWIDMEVDTDPVSLGYDCNYWVSNLAAVLDYFNIIDRADDIYVPEPLQRSLIPHTCILQVELPDGNIREWCASIGEDIVFTVEAEGDSTYIATSIADLKKLGIERINLISTYAVEGFEQIK